MLSVLLSLAAPLLAQEPFLLRHSVVEMEPSSSGTVVTYRLVLENQDAQHNYQDVRLALQDVSLSLTAQSEIIQFHTLSTGLQKHRFASLNSALSGEQLDMTSLLFHLEAVDELGRPYTLLLRSEEGQP